MSKEELDVVRIINDSGIRRFRKDCDLEKVRDFAKKQGYLISDFNHCSLYWEVISYLNGDVKKNSYSIVCDDLGASRGREDLTAVKNFRELDDLLEFYLEFGTQDIIYSSPYTVFTTPESYDYIRNRVLDIGCKIENIGKKYILKKKSLRP